MKKKESKPNRSSGKKDLLGSSMKIDQKPAAEPQKVGSTTIAGDGTVQQSSSGAPAEIGTAEQGNPVADLKDQFQKDASEVRTKRKYTRRQKTDEEPAPDEGQNAAAFSELGKVALRFIAVRMPNPIPPSPEEEEFFSDALGKVIVKYLPSGGEYVPELTLAAAAIAFSLPRLITPKEETPS